MTKNVKNSQNRPIFDFLRKLSHEIALKRLIMEELTFFQLFPKSACLGKLWFLHKLTLIMPKIKKSTFGGMV